MRISKSRPILCRAAVAAAVPVLCLALVGDAFAGPRHGSSSVSRTGPGGHTASRTSQLSTTGAGGYSASSTATGPRGNQATRQQSGGYDAATQTYSRSGTSTGPAGNSTSFSTAVQKTDDGMARTGTRTGPNGRSTNESRTVTRTRPAPSSGN